MTPIRRVALIGNSLPRRCGIATFTTDLCQAISTCEPVLETSIVAMTDQGRSYDYPPAVRLQIAEACEQSYLDAADAMNADRYDVVSLQHEFGIFGGEAGRHVLPLLSRLNMPIVTTLHTVLAQPGNAQRDVLNGIVDVSSRVIVMAEKARELLRVVYRVPAEKIEVIPHGIPDAPFAEPGAAKAKLGFVGKSVILTFGLLSPNKGIEVMIDAMPAILKRSPNAVYVVLGATHPSLLRQQGDAYRETLLARALERGVAGHVVFLNQFVDQATLIDFISMCDIYVTPYLNEAQMTSGTLAYSFGLGKPVVSTPYWHARELLADGRGTLVPFGDSVAIGQEIMDLLRDDCRRQAMGRRAYASSRSMTWGKTAERYLKVFDVAMRGHRLHVIPRASRALPPPRAVGALPEVQLGHFLSMCDDTGLFQHAVYSVPDRSHGYCVDDNARALLLSCALNHPRELDLPDALSARLAAFIQHAWNPDIGRFRNFMGFNRCWLEDVGSEDSQGRTLWAIGECARSASSASRRAWARSLFAKALPGAEGFRSPRAWAFAMLGLNAYCAAAESPADADHLRRLLADRLMAIFAAVATPDWVWFEDGLSYDNARLSQALIDTGVATTTPAYLDVGLRSLRWLTAKQKTEDGLFRPVGTRGFHGGRAAPEAFDQQPLEAAATISACVAAWYANGDSVWKGEAERAFAWFRGANDLGLALVDEATGGCRDGLHPDRANENRGGESVVSYLLSLTEMRQLVRATHESPSLALVHGLRV